MFRERLLHMTPRYPNRTRHRSTMPLKSTHEPVASSSALRPAAGPETRHLSFFAAIVLLFVAGCGNSSQIDMQEPHETATQVRDNDNRVRQDEWAEDLARTELTVSDGDQAAAATTMPPAEDPTEERNSDCRGPAISDDNIESSPIREAIARTNIKLLEAELDAGADANERLSDGNTPLHFAAHYSWSEPKIIAMLLEAGADPNANNNRCLTPLHLLPLHDLYRRSPIVVDATKLLLDAGANPNAKSFSDSSTPLHQVASDGNTPRGLELGQLLLDAGADPNSQIEHDSYHQGETPLLKFVRYAKFASPTDAPSLEFLDLLLAYGADVNLHNVEGETALSQIARNSSLSSTAVFNRLLEAGADPNGYEENGRPLYSLIYSIRRTGGPDQVEAQLGKLDTLLAADVDPRDEVSSSSKERNFPIHLAIQEHEAAKPNFERNGLIEVVRLLLKFGADPNRKNEDGKTALDMSESSDMRLLLLEAGAKRSS